MINSISSKINEYSKYERDFRPLEDVSYFKKKKKLLIENQNFPKSLNVESPIPHRDSTIAFQTKHETAICYHRIN